MRLLYTPRSHFSRKVRILLHAYGLAHELVDAGRVEAGDPAAFGPNPLMKVPTLVDGDAVVMDSDQIAAYLARRYDPDDRYGVLTTGLDALNARAVMNGIMAAEVELLLARRAGVDTRAFARYDKLRASMAAGLAWLEARSAVFPQAPSYLGFHLVALWDHIVLYDLMPLEYPALRACVARLEEAPGVAETRPH